MDELLTKYRRSINPPYSWKDYLNLTLTFLLLLALPVGIYLAQRPQDIRQRAQEITQPHPGKPETPSVTDEILVKFKPGVNEKAKEKVLKEHGLEVRSTIPQIDVILVHVPEQARDRVIEALKHNPRVEHAGLNYLAEEQATPNDPIFVDQWELTKVGAPAAWDISKGSSSVVIGVVDSGILTTHEDLQNKLWVNPGEIAGNNIDDDNNGYIDDINGWNVIDNNGNVADVRGHGTLVAGVAGADTNNSKGIASLGWNTKIMPVRCVTIGGSCPYGAMIAAIIYAADNGAKLINVSWGGTSPEPLLEETITYAWNKGAVVVAAAGDQGVPGILYPAHYPSVISVGKTDGSDGWAASNTDDTDPNTLVVLDVMAPGVALQTTSWSGGYFAVGGSSVSAPMVAGLAALILSAKPGLSPQQITDNISSTALDLGDPGWDPIFGYGRIQADKALQKTTGIIPPPPDTTSPTVSISSPTLGSTVSGILDITADATDNVGVTKVEFYIDGILLGSTCCPNLSGVYVASWDTTAYSNSSHTLLVKAYDLANNIGTSSSITVTVSNTSPTPTPSPSPSPISSDTTPPTVSITNPLNGTTVKTSSKVNITASASDNISVSKVEFYVNGSLKYTATTAPYTFTWKLPGTPTVTYTLVAKAYDGAGNIATSTVIITSSR